MHLIESVNVSMHLMSYKINVKNAHCAVSPKLAVVCDVCVNGMATVADPEVIEAAAVTVFANCSCCLLSM